MTVTQTRFLDNQTSPLLIRQLNEKERRGKRTVLFQLSDEWLQSPSFFQFYPKLLKSRGFHYPEHGKRIFGSIGDSAPDTWGRQLLDRRELKVSETKQRTRRSLSQIDHLLGVADFQRLGALRFSVRGRIP